MKAINKNRRNFLKSAVLGATVLTTGCNDSNILSKDKNAVALCPKIRDSWQAEVLVVGGGPAGIGAAIGAAKSGADTLLIENYGFFGGVAAWVSGWS